MNTVLELPSFARSIRNIWSAEELSSFVTFIAANPTAGAIIQGTGGLRKVRWSRDGIGTRGGTRIVYYYHNPRNPIYLFYAYPKNAKDDLTSEERKIFAAAIQELKRHLKS